MLYDLDEGGRGHVVTMVEFDRNWRRDHALYWSRVNREDQEAIEDAIQRRLDEVAQQPNPRWGSIMNTSIEGGRVSPDSGLPGDWSGTPFAPIYEACSESHDASRFLFGMLWKRAIIRRPEKWIGMRATDERPTFPERGITLMGKTYFVPR